MDTVTCTVALWRNRVVEGRMNGWRDERDGGQTGNGVKGP